MPNDSSNQPDINQLAAEIMRTTTSERQKPTQNLHATALGRLGGRKGGKARAAKLSANKRQRIAKQAATA